MTTYAYYYSLQMNSSQSSLSTLAGIRTEPQKSIHTVSESQQQSKWLAWQQNTSGGEAVLEMEALETRRHGSIGLRSKSTGSGLPGLDLGGVGHTRSGPGLGSLVPTGSGPTGSNKAGPTDTSS